MTGFRFARTVLSDPLVDVAVLETAQGGTGLCTSFTSMDDETYRVLPNRVLPSRMLQIWKL
jgi:hypothetical protein